MADAKEAPAPAGNPLDKAADRLRDSARWLLASSGAVAVVVFAGLTVSDLGELDGDTPGFRLTIALAGAAAAVVAIVVALGRAMGLAGASTTTLEDLVRADPDGCLRAARAEATRDPALTTWDGDVEAFLADYRRAYDEYVLQAEAYAGDAGKRPDASSLRKAQFHLEALSQVVTRLLRTVSFLRLQAEFRAARRAIVASMVVAAIGAGVMGWATTGVPADEPPELADRPAAGVLRPAADVVAELNRQRPASCAVAVGDEVAVVVLTTDGEGDDATARAVTVPTTACAPVRVTVPVVQVTRT